jgi:hypothetical protein
VCGHLGLSGLGSARRLPSTSVIGFKVCSSGHWRLMPMSWNRRSMLLVRMSRGKPFSRPFRVSSARNSQCHPRTSLRRISDQVQSGVEWILDHTLSLSSVTESFRSDRLVMCLNAAHATLGSDGASHILLDIRNRRWPELLQSVEMGDSLRRWGDSNGLACLGSARLGDFLLRLGLGLRYPRLT